MYPSFIIFMIQDHRLWRHAKGPLKGWRGTPELAKQSHRRKTVGFIITAQIPRPYTY